MLIELIINERASLIVVAVSVTKSDFAILLLLCGLQKPGGFLYYFVCALNIWRNYESFW